MTPEHRAALLELCKAQEAENSRLRQLLDEIHRGEATPPRAPKVYDEAAQEREDA